MNLFILLILIIILLVGSSYFIVKKRELKCPVCKSKEYKRTGNKKLIEQSGFANIAMRTPYYKYEYKCLNCGNLYWSIIEGMIY